MPLFDVIGLGGEKLAVILDIGAAYTKCGFAGEASPRHIVPTVLKRVSHGGKTEIVKVIPDDVSKVKSEELCDIFHEFLHDIYFRYLLVTPKDRRVVICESLLCPSVVRETLAKVLFKHFEVPSILFAPTHLMTTFILGVPTALVIDCGYTESLVLPVYEGIPILPAWEALPLAAKAIHKHLLESLLEKSMVQLDKGIKPLSSVTDTIDENVLEDIKVRTCFVAPKFSGPKNEPRPDSMVPLADYPLGGGQILRLEGQVREQTFDILFEGDEEEQSLATAILDCIMKCPIDTRKQLAENIVLIGGTSVMPGFRHRLMQELHVALRSPRYKDVLFIKTIKMHKTPVPENCAAWLGAAIFGATEILADRSVSKDSYLKKNCLPDWNSCDPELILDAMPLVEERLHSPRRTMLPGSSRHLSKK